MNKLHYIHSRNGRIGGRADTTSGDVDAIVRALSQDQRKHLVLHFHGGLVSKNCGLTIANKLLPVYSPSAGAGGYPVFFVWEAGAWETIRNNLTELAGEPVFKQLLRKLLQYALEKLGGQGGSGTAREFPLAGVGSRAQDVRNELHNFWAPPGRKTIPFQGIKPVATAGQARTASTAISENEIMADLQGDDEFLRALATLPDLPQGTRSTFARGAKEERSVFSEMLSVKFSKNKHTRGLVELYIVVKYLAKVLLAILSRYEKGRDHGMYATCVEELVRGFTVGGSAANEWAKALEWNRMKQDTADAFDPDPDVHAGTALLSRLKAAFASGLELDRITLVGHSTGAIYIAHWLENSTSYLPEGFKQDVVYLAPAITYDYFADTLRKCGSGIGNFRMFAMHDQFEREDQVWGQDSEISQDWRRFIYPSSLLYLVSGILETKVMANGTLADEADIPLLGMERFFTDSATYTGADFSAVDYVRAWLGARSQSVVWSKTTGQPAGLNSECIDHGNFDDEKLTIESLGHIIEVGF